MIPSNARRLSDKPNAAVPGQPPPRRYVRFTRWRRRHFFAVLAESGNVKVAAEAAGFVEKMAAAVDAADVRWRDGADATAGDSVLREGRFEGLVIRRGIGGRLRAMVAGAHWWSEQDDAVFLEHLRESGNAAGSARAAGFTPKSAWNRREKLPSFAHAWDAAVEEAQGRLEARLVALAGGGHWGMAPGAVEIEEPPFDPWLALWILKREDRKRNARARGG